MSRVVVALALAVLAVGCTDERTASRAAMAKSLRPPKIPPNEKNLVVWLYAKETAVKQSENTALVVEIYNQSDLPLKVRSKAMLRHIPAPPKPGVKVLPARAKFMPAKIEPDVHVVTIEVHDQKRMLWKLPTTATHSGPSRPNKDLVVAPGSRAFLKVWIASYSLRAGKYEVLASLSGRGGKLVLAKSNRLQVVCTRDK